jgi:hypothetical protein
MASTLQINEPLNANISINQGAKKGRLPLVAWVMNLVENSRRTRDRVYKARWDAYERTFRGRFSTQDKTRDGERSKLIAPALLQAIDSISATIEDAIFSRNQWFDALDDINDPEREDVEKMRLLLNEDLDIAGVPDAISKIVLNGCLYGTGIGKINVIQKEIRTISSSQQGPQVQKSVRPLVTLEPIPPWEFVIDSQARRLEDALFVAHETHVPRTVVWNKIKKKVYRNVPVTGFNATKVPTPGGRQSVDLTNAYNKDDGSVWVTEYYGKVPQEHLRAYLKVKPEDVEGNGMVECIITIANENELLRVMVNPFFMKDRPIIAYQHDIVPGKFWGRGVAEKGWNAQRALDAELRARMDALGLLTSPMMGADITRLPRNPDMRVRPGKVWLTRGRPSEVLEPIILGNIDPSTFNQSSEMERLVQVATGSVESNAPLNSDRRNETASGISMIQSSALKRMRRTMWNLERQFLNPLIRKATWRYIQFNPRRYPQDLEFVVKGTMGIVAREFEQSNLTALLSVVSPDSPSYQIILKGVVELSGTPKRDELLKAIDQANQPDPEAEKLQKMQMQMQMDALQLANEKEKKEIEKLQAQIALIAAETEHEKVVTDLEDDKIEIQAANAVIGREKAKMGHRQNEIAAERNEIDKIAARAKSKETKSGK